MYISCTPTMATTLIHTDVKLGLTFERQTKQQEWCNEKQSHREVVRPRRFMQSVVVLLPRTTLLTHFLLHGCNSQKSPQL